MKNKKRYKMIGIISVIIISVLILLSMWIFFYKGNEDNPVGRIENGLNIKIINKDVKQDIDTHKFPNGDGERFIEIDCNRNTEELKENLEEYYPKLPLPKELENLVYNELNGMELGSKIPKVDNGYYYFIDRHADNLEGENDNFEKIVKRNSYNFTLVIYNLDTNMIYHYQLDT